MNYNPRRKTREMLERAWKFVDSAPYRVSARWLFYRLFQEGYYGEKGDYHNRFLPAISAARKHFYAGWRPDTLADDSRSSIYRGEGFGYVADWLASVARSKCTLTVWLLQPCYLEIWFEAAAMAGEFEHYTENITLRPFQGDPSIPFKWQIAKDLEEAHRRYQKEIMILYFGDYDPKVLLIPESALADIRAWCETDFEFRRVGITLEQAVKYNIPENPDKPGQYQWKALEDKAAGALITGAVNEFFDPDLAQEVPREERRAKRALRDRFGLIWGKVLRSAGDLEEQP